MIYDQSLLYELDLIVNDMHVSNQDLPIAIFGNEGSGKSSCAENLAVYLDRTMSVEVLETRLCQTFEDFAMKVPDIPDFKAAWWDEAHRFSKRGSYDTDINRVLLEYFQDIRGRRRIYLLCFPELREIDRKVIQRCRLFFETVKKGGKFWVRGWSQKQIQATIDCYRLPSAKSKGLRWAGLPFNPIRVFAHDYKDFPDALQCSIRPDPIPSVSKLNQAYKSFKDGSLRRSDALLKSYGCKDTTDVANEIMRLSGYSYEYSRELASDHTNKALDELWGNKNQLEVLNGRYKIKDTTIFKRIVESALEGKKCAPYKGGTAPKHRSIPKKVEEFDPMDVNEPYITS